MVQREICWSDGVDSILTRYLEVALRQRSLANVLVAAASPVTSTTWR